MSFNANDKRVYDLLNDKEYIMPINQRKYIWNKNNWTELLDDIMLVFDEKKNDHFIGSIVLKKETINNGIRNHYSIIDGQQRISTLTIMLCAIGFLFAQNDRKDLFDGLYKPLFVNDNRNVRHPIISNDANKTISNLVEDLFFCVEQHFESKMPLICFEDFTEQHIHDKNIRDCFAFFFHALGDRYSSDMDQLERYRTIVDDIRYIDIVAEKDEDAYTIFEILNARGQVLTDYELLCNYLLSHADKDRKNEAKQKLETIKKLLGKDIEIFLKHYVTHKIGKKTDKAENRPYKVIVRYAKGKNTADLLNDLTLKAQYYTKIISYENCSELEKKIFSFFKPRRQQQFRPIVLGMMHQKDLGTLTQAKYNIYLEFLYEFFICYHVIGEQTSNKIEDVVYAYSAKIENEFSESVLNDFRKSMIKRIPGEKAFKSSIKNIRYSHHWTAFSDSKKRENVRAIFEVIERELGYRDSFEGCTVEHCLPDALSEENSQIGNLMLLEETINKQCDSKNIATKCQYYEKSTLKLPHIVAEDMAEGKGFIMENRSNWIAETLYNYIINVASDC